MGIVDIRRGRGRPKRSCGEVVKQDMTLLQLKEEEDMKVED